MKEATKTIYENLKFTHKVHEKQCELLALGAFLIRIVSVLLICVVLFLQFWQIIDTGHSQLITIWSIIFTVIEVGVAFFQLNFNYDNLLDQHRTVAKSLLSIKNRFIVSKASSMSQKQLDSFVAEINEIYSGAPQTNKLAKWMANREDK